MKKLNVLVIILLLSNFCKADLSGIINNLINQPDQKNVKYSVQIVKADSGTIIYSHHASEPLIPASNMKIVTTSAALKYFGPDFEYVTRVGLCGDSLVVIGSGDPLFGFIDPEKNDYQRQKMIFENIIAAMKQKNISSVNDIIVDVSIFDEQRVHPNWPENQLNREYACEVSGLNFSGNCIYMTIKNTGQTAEISIEPDTNYVEIINQVKTSGKNKNAVGAYRQAGKPNTLLVSGMCKKIEGPFGVAIENPGAFFGFVLAENLKKAGINVTGKLVGKKIENEKIVPLTEFRTPLSECLAKCNKDSLSLGAESLFKTMASKAMPDNKNGSWQAGQLVISRYLKNIGIEANEFKIDDGSGLSRQNKLSANVLTNVLLEIYKTSNWNFYKESLAIGGQDGTIEKYFKEKKYNGKIFAKTGYLSGVKSLSGVCATEKGDYIFSIITNDTNGKTRDCINNIVKAIIDN